MALGKRPNPLIKDNNDTGFGANAANYGGRFLNKNGTYNIVKQGAPFWKRYSLYQAMLQMPVWRLLGVYILFFILINLFFTVIYIAIGVGEFQGFLVAGSWGKIKELLYFSAETFTTVGYGRLNPVGDAANIVASFEAMFGFLSFAVATGIIYGRFSKPKPFIAFSHHALVAPYKGITGLMFRIAPYKDGHTLNDAQVQVTLSIKLIENEKEVYKFYNLELERRQIDSLMMTWTIVHPITAESPLVGLSANDMREADIEIYASLRGFDSVYSNTVLTRTSYIYEEIVHGAKFEPMFNESEDGKTTIIHLNKLDAYRTIPN